MGGTRTTCMFQYQRKVPHSGREGRYLESDIWQDVESAKMRVFLTLIQLTLVSLLQVHTTPTSSEFDGLYHHKRLRNPLYYLSQPQYVIVVLVLQTGDSI